MVVDAVKEIIVAIGQKLGQRATTGGSARSTFLSCGFYKFPYFWVKPKARCMNFEKSVKFVA